MADTDDSETGNEETTDQADVPGLSDDSAGFDGVDVASLANHVVYVAVAFAITGIGFGVTVFLLSRFGADATIVQGTSGQGSAAFTEAVINVGITVALFFPLFLAPVIGFVVNFSIDDDMTALIAATLGVLLGTVLFYVLTGATGGAQYPTRQAMRGGTYQLRFVLARGITNGVIVGFITGSVAGVAAVLGQRLD